MYHEEYEDAYEHRAECYQNTTFSHQRTSWKFCALEKTQSTTFLIPEHSRVFELGVVGAYH